MTQMKYFFLNGQKFCTKNDLNILDIIQYFNYNTSLLVLEYNNLIFNKQNWKKTVIQNNDKIEVVTIVGGG
jgi:sulfur carrier protein